MIIPFLRPEFSEKSLTECVKSIKSGWLAYGPYTEEAEKLFEEFFESNNFLMTSSCTASLQLALMLSGVQSGDEVITTPLTWVATSNVILYQGAKIVFVDVDPNTGLISIDEILKKITKRTKAIITVDLYGMMLDYDELRKRVGASDIAIIEDAAHAIGSKFDNKSPGHNADYCCFSFHAAKNITSGQGGGLICRNPEKYAEAKLLRRDGVSGTNASRRMYSLGHKFDSTDFQSALLINQIKNYHLTHTRRVDAYNRYVGIFNESKYFRFQKVTDRHQHSGHMFVLWLNDVDKRASLINYLDENGVQVSVHYNPVHLEPFYVNNLGYKVGMFPEAEKIGAGAISMPTYPSITLNEQEYILSLINKFYKNYN